MSAPVDMLDLAYVGGVVGSMVLLAVLWGLLPRLFGAEAVPARPAVAAPPRPARTSRPRAAPVLRTPPRRVLPPLT